MEEASVAIFEDNKDMTSYVVAVLKDDEHKIAAIAANVQEAHLLVSKLLDGEIEADVVIMDGALTPGSSREGAELSARLAELNIPIIGFSTEDAPWSTVDLGKRNADKLLQTIADL